MLNFVIELPLFCAFPKITKGRKSKLLAVKQAAALFVGTQLSRQMTSFMDDPKKYSWAIYTDMTVAQNQQTQLVHMGSVHSHDQEID